MDDPSPDRGDGPEDAAPSGADGRHSHGDHGAHRSTTRALVVSLAINTVFFVVVLGGALVAGSVTLLAEAIHMLTDSLSLVLALVAARLAAVAADSRRTYGYHRVEVLGGLANGLLLLAAVGYVLVEALEGFRNPTAVDAPVVIVVGSVGLFANLAAAWVLVGHRDSLNVEGAFLHLVADAAGSVAAVALGVALLFTDLYVLDPLFAVLIAGLVLYSTKDLFVDGVNILLQGAPRDVDPGELSAALRETPGVEDVHHVHVWALDSTRTALSAHLVVEDGADGDAVLARAREVGADHGVDHATLQLESSTFSETHQLDCHRESE